MSKYLHAATGTEFFKIKAKCTSPQALLILNKQNRTQNNYGASSASSFSQRFDYGQNGLHFNSLLESHSCLKKNMQEKKVSSLFCFDFDHYGFTAHENQKSTISNYNNISISVWTNYGSNSTNKVHFLISFSSCNHNHGEVCWLTAFHDEGKPQKASAEKTGWSVLCQSISMETWLGKKKYDMVGKYPQAGMAAALRGLSG